MIEKPISDILDNSEYDVLHLLFSNYRQRGYKRITFISVMY